MSKLRILSIILLTALNIYLPGNIFSKGNVEAPDFAYPQTVTKDAEKALNTALKNGDGTATVRALADIALAQTLIGNDKLPAVVKQIEEIQHKEKDAVTRSLLSMLLADIYLDIYLSRKYDYDRRELPLTPLPAEYAEWSGEQFRNYIDRLCTEALLHADSLQTKPLADYRSIITSDRDTEIYYPTLYDFAASFTIDTRKALSPFSNSFSLIYLSARTLFETTVMMVPSSPIEAAMLDTYAKWLKFNEGKTAPTINIDLQRIRTVSNRLYRNLREQGEKREAALYIDLYNQYKDSEHSGLILLQMANLSQYNLSTNQANAKNLANKLRYNIAKFPSFRMATELQKTLEEMEKSAVAITIPDAIAPGHDFKIEVGSTNTPSFIIDFYKVIPDSRTRDEYNTSQKRHTLVKSLTINTPGELPFVCDTVVTTSLPDEGCYIATVRKDSSDKIDNRSYNIIRSSRLSLGAITLSSEGFLTVIDPLTGSPVSRATLLSRNPWEENSVTTVAGKSDSQGFFILNATESAQYFAEKGTDTYSAPVSIYQDNGYNNDAIRMSAVTDLSIYHPGDTVKWAAVAYSSTENGEAPKADTRMFVYLTMANNTAKAVSETTATTDQWGRTTGSFVLPKDLLTGYATIEFHLSQRSSGDETRDFVIDPELCYSTQFMVSDYKLPTFKVDINAVNFNTPTQGDVTLKGDARTFAGTRLDGGTVKLDLSVSQPVWWMRSNAVQFYSAEGSLGNDGSFSFELPELLFTSSPAPKGIYTARITVTSKSGESRQTSRTFTLGPTYTLTLNIDENIERSHPVKLNLQVIDGEGNVVSQDVRWTLTSTDGGEQFKGCLQSSHPVADWTDVKSGSYRADFYLADNDSVAAYTVGTLVLYRTTDKSSPVKELLWTPSRKITTSPKLTANLLYATAEPDEHLLYTLVSNEQKRIIERRWITPGEGMHQLEIKLPADVEKATARLSVVKDFRTQSISIEVVNPASERSLEIITETFRDKITPGMPERWSFRTVNKDSTGREAAMMLNMYNSAIRSIDGLTIKDWRLDIHRYYYHQFEQKSPAVSGSHRYSTNNSYSIRRSADNQIAPPLWQLYGMDFRTYQPVFMEKRMMPVPMRAYKQDMAVVEESAAMNLTDGAVESATTTSTAAEEPEFEYRDCETPSAFFAPILTTDAEGGLTYTFTTPNANTTWTFEALAYDKEMNSSNISRQVPANKPVMVQSNLPRFIRTGDSGLVRATVINNSDTTQLVTTTVELFDPITGKVLSTSQFSDTIAAETSAIVTSTVNAPDAPFIGYRIKSATDSYADGEQDIIAVLPYTTPVIETIPFYIDADSTRSEISLPELPADARVTLQYCDNPSWYVVTALPGLTNSNPTSTTEAAAAIYSAAIADGLLRTNPSISEAIKYWEASNKTDSTLVSMLERNTDLKTVLLSATPWMMDARSDTERMERLMLLFDRKEIDAVIDASVEKLKKLQNPDGGFAWCDLIKESSPWATAYLLQRLGELNKLGWLPDDKALNRMITPALEYLQSSTIKEWRRYPKDSYMQYVRILDLWPSFKPSKESKSIINSTVQGLLSKWKKMDVANKAEVATLLYHHDYKSMAQSILQSLREYAVDTPGQGMYWPSVGDGASGHISELGATASALEAFAEIEPGCKEVDRIRQWLILQKETRNWGNSSVTTKVILAILTTSQSWVEQAGAFSVTLNGRQVVPDGVEKYLGYFRTDISKLSPSSGVIAIEKQQPSPSWGAVYNQYTARMTDVKPQSCEALSISKRFLKKSGDEWVDADSFAVGDRVKVLLTVKSSRALQYVAITDQRAACFEPVDQIPTPLYSEGICFYRENRDSSTNLFVTNLPKGTYQLSYELWTNNAGTFASGIATAQSQYAPEIEAHSSGTRLLSNP